MRINRYGSQNRFQIMSYEQIRRLFHLLNDSLVICCEVGSEEPLQLTLFDVITEMERTLVMENIQIKDIRLIGGAATYVISCSDSFCFKDIDLVFCVNPCNNLDVMDKIRLSVLAVIKRLAEKCSLLPDGDVYPERYIKKQVCVQNPHAKDYWSLFCLGCCTDISTDIIELKFASSIERQYECSVDSFQIVLDPALHFIEQYRSVKITKDLYPTVVCQSVWGCIKEALSHVHNRQIVIENPEQIRGGGLLKYCKLLVEGFTPHPDLDVKYVEKYMCSRFFIDFPLLRNQQDKILSYLVNHFPCDHDIYVSFLCQLSHIVKTSSVYIGIDRLRSVFLINSIMQQITTPFYPEISLSEFNDSDKWSVGEILLGSFECHPDTKSSCSSISYSTDVSPDQSLDIDSCHDDTP